MTREEFYKLTDILNSEVLGNFMHGGEADELIAMFEEAVEHSNILEQEEPVNEDLEKEVCRYINDNDIQKLDNILIKEGIVYVGVNNIEDIARHFANWQKKQDQSTIELAEDHAMLAGMEKMKEQMMKDAEDLVVGIDANGLACVNVDDVLPDDTVRVLVIKED